MPRSSAVGFFTVRQGINLPKKTRLLYFGVILLSALLIVPFGSTDVFYYLGAARDEVLRGINPYLGGFYK